LNEVGTSILGTSAWAGVYVTQVFFLHRRQLKDSFCFGHCRNPFLTLERPSLCMHFGKTKEEKKTEKKKDTEVKPEVTSIAQ